MERSILLVEDDFALREALELALRDDGYDVRTAVDGVEALDVLSQEPVDLIISDLMMPNLDGQGLLAELRRGGSDIPMVAICSKRPSQPMMDVVALLAKPFDLDTLFEIVERELQD